MNQMQGSIVNASESCSIVKIKTTLMRCVHSHLSIYLLVIGSGI